MSSCAYFWDVLQHVPLFPSSSCGARRRGTHRDLVLRPPSQQRPKTRDSPLPVLLRTPEHQISVAAQERHARRREASAQVLPLWRQADSLGQSAQAYTFEALLPEDPLTAPHRANTQGRTLKSFFSGGTLISFFFFAEILSARITGFRKRPVFLAQVSNAGGVGSRLQIFVPNRMVTSAFVCGSCLGMFRFLQPKIIGPIISAKGGFQRMVVMIMFVS